MTDDQRQQALHAAEHLVEEEQQCDRSQYLGKQQWREHGEPELPAPCPQEADIENGGRGADQCRQKRRDKSEPDREPECIDELAGGKERAVPAQRQSGRRERQIFRRIDGGENDDRRRKQQEDIDRRHGDKKHQPAEAHDSLRIARPVASANTTSTSTTASDSTSASAAPNGHRKPPSNCCTTTVAMVCTRPPPSSMGMT